MKELRKNINVLSQLASRVSVGVLTNPGPTDEQLTWMFKVALRAPDHYNLKPWRFVVIKGKGRENLGKIFGDVALKNDPMLAPEALDRTCRLPLRAPVLVALILTPRQHDCVPKIEQVLSLGAAGGGLLMAAHCMGIGAYWRTGKICFDKQLANAMGVAEHEQLLGFVYLGTPKRLKEVPLLDPSHFVSFWEEEEQ